MRKLIILTLLCFFLIPIEGSSAHTKKKRKKKRKVSRVSTPRAKSTANMLVVSFISFGGGIDYKAIPEFETDMKTFNKDNYCDIIYETRDWGREGERDYCISAKTPSCLENYCSHIKRIFKDHDRILIKENSTCRH